MNATETQTNNSISNSILNSNPDLNSNLTNSGVVDVTNATSPKPPIMRRTLKNDMEDGSVIDRLF